jgi:hypothetical protein
MAARLARAALMGCCSSVVGLCNACLTAARARLRARTQTMSAAIKQRMASQPMASRAGGATVRPGEGRSVATDKSSCC